MMMFSGVLICLSADWCGHTARECSGAIQQSKELFRLLPGLQEFEFINVSGDSGGTAKVQALHPTMIEDEVMADWTSLVLCFIHNIHTAPQTASERSFGSQGQGNCTAFQMVFLFTKLVKLIKAEGGKDLMCEWYAHGVDHLMNCSDWQDEASRLHKQPHAHFLDKIDAEDVDADVDEEKLSGLFKCPKNIGSPNFMRWGSTYSVAKLLVDNFIEIRCLGKASPISAIQLWAGRSITMLSRPSSSGSTSSSRTSILRRTGDQVWPSPACLAASPYLPEHCGCWRMVM